MKPTNKHLNIPIDIFVEKVNAALASLESDMKITKVSNASKNHGRTAKINDSLAYTLWCVPKRRIITGLTFIGGGKGTLDSGVDVMKGLVATIMAVSGAINTEASGAVMYMLDKDKPDTAEINGIKYKLTLNKGFGTWLTATAAEEKETIADEQK